MALTRLALLVPFALVVGCYNWPPGQPPVADPPFPPFDGGGFPFDGGDFFPSGPQPSFGQTVTAATPPPALSGGTLIALADGKTLVAADPDRDQVYVVDTSSGGGVKTIALTAGDEPGRLAEGPAGRVHVALRRGGALVTIDVAKATISERRGVCASPRGVAYQKAGDQVHVACASGELVTLPASTGAATRTLTLERDLRDVVVDGDKLLVSTFRTANVLELASNGTISARRTVANSAAIMSTTLREFAPSVAWRMIPAPAGGALLVHQRSLVPEVPTKPGSPSGAYGGSGKDPCDSPIVHGTVTKVASGETPAVAPMIAGAVLPIDVAAHPTQDEVSVIAAGNAKLPLPQVLSVRSGSPIFGSGCMPPSNSTFVAGEAVAIAYTLGGELAIQSREPAQLTVGSRTFTLSTDSRADTGHAVFHANAGGGLACASCHPEGGDDAHVWRFAGLGPRRTQTLRGGISGSEPFHWSGDMATFRHLVDEVFSRRMSGPSLDQAQEQAALRFVDKLPPLPVRVEPLSPVAMRGSALFNGSAGCAACHNGTHYTNNQTLNVGTGGFFQVPSLLGIASRAPFIHSGCASTLTARFDPGCGGGDAHGKTSQLTPMDIADLVSFLETL